MQGLVAGLVGWFRGKKTILGGALVIAGAVGGVWYGKLDPTSGLTVAGIGLSIAGYGAKANRHQAELLAALQGVARIGADVRAGKPAAGDLQAVTGQLAPGIAGEAINLGGASLHLSAPTTDELLAAVSKLTAQQTTTGVR